MLRRRVAGRRAWALNRLTQETAERKETVTPHRFHSTIQNPKFEIRNKPKIQRGIEANQNPGRTGFVLDLPIWLIENCFGFRTSDFRFGQAVSSVNPCDQASGLSNRPRLSARSVEETVSLFVAGE